MERETRGGKGDWGDVLAVGFGVTVLSWALGYLGRLPGVELPSWLLGVMFLAALVGGGMVAGRLSGRGWRAGVHAGVLAAALDLVVLGSVLGGEHPGRMATGAGLRLVGWVLAGAVLGGVGGSLGALTSRRPVAAERWTGAFAAVGAVATFLLLLAGGVVTSANAGLAVVDWPNSFGYNMFLYPLSRMTGGIYYEHAHRLAGSLVGLTTVVLALHLQRREARRWVRRIAWLAVLVVMIQGVLGGLRVTGRFTLSTSPEEVAPNLALAVVHGVLGQLFFGMMVVLTVATSRAWRRVRECVVTTGGRGAGRGLSAALVLALVVQLVLGAVQRHLAFALLVHISFAVVVVALAIAVFVQCGTVLREIPVVPSLGRVLTVLVAVQVVLGVVALVVIGGGRAAAEPGVLELLVATAHQVVGALLLACAVALTALVRARGDVGEDTRDTPLASDKRRGRAEEAGAA